MENNDLRYGHSPTTGNLLTSAMELTEYQSHFSDQSATILAGQVGEYVLPESFDENGNFLGETFLKNLVTFFQKSVVTAFIQKENDFLAFSSVDWSGPESPEITDTVVDNFLESGMKRIADVWNAEQEKKERQNAAHKVLCDNMYSIRHLRPEEYATALESLKKNIDAALKGEDYSKSIFTEQNGLKTTSRQNPEASRYDDSESDEFVKAMSGVESFHEWLAKNVHNSDTHSLQSDFEKMNEHGQITKKQKETNDDLHALLMGCLTKDEPGIDIQHLVSQDHLNAQMDRIENKYTQEGESNEVK